MRYQYEEFAVPDRIKISYANFNDRKMGYSFKMNQNADLLLFDEPENCFKGDEFDPLYLQIKQRETTMIYITHHLDFVEKYADQVLVMHYGAFKGSYSKDDFFNNDDPFISHISRMGC